MGHRSAKFLGALIAVLSCVALQAGRGFCYDDGFGAARQEKSRHFTVSYAPSVDPVSLAMQLDVRPQAAFAGTQGSTLSDMLDALFSRVCDVLDMQLYSYEGNIKICRDAEHLNSVFRALFGRPVPAPSFYVSELNTIYVDPEHFTQAVVGHEMGHAIMGHYFVVAPPEKVSEILAGYVEYQLRKK